MSGTAAPKQVMDPSGRSTICSLCGSVVPAEYHPPGNGRWREWYTIGKGPAWESHVAWHASLES